MGGEHEPVSLTSRPLCVPVNAKPGWTSYGIKQDGQLHHIMGGPVFFPSLNDGNTGILYIAPEDLPVLAFDVEDGRIRSGPRISELVAFGVQERRTQSGLPFSQFVTTFTASRHPGGILSLSSAGHDTATGIVWLSHFRDPGPAKGLDATRQIHDGVLEAFDATNLRLLWSSDGKLEDGVGYFQKFTPPTVANGKVYLAASPSPVSSVPPITSLCSRIKTADGTDPCFFYDQTASQGRIVVYGELPRRWPWEIKRD